MSTLSNKSHVRLQDIREAASQIATLKQRITELENFVASALEQAEQPAGLDADNIIAFPASIIAPNGQTLDDRRDETVSCEVVPLPDAMRSLLLNPPPAAARRTDNLELIRGIDADVAVRLANEGFSQFVDLAELTPEAVKDLSTRLDLGTRINRQNWIEQAAILAQGKCTAFATAHLASHNSPATAPGSLEIDEEIDEPPPPRSIIIATEPLGAVPTGDGFLASETEPGTLKHKTIAHHPQRPKRDWGPVKAMMASLACTAVIAASSGMMGPNPLAYAPAVTTSPVVNSAHSLGSHGITRVFRSLMPKLM